MASYNGKDIDRVCRASGMSRAQADALLRQYDGRPDRVGAGRRLLRTRLAPAGTRGIASGERPDVAGDPAGSGHRARRPAAGIGRAVHEAAAVTHAIA